MSEKFIDLAEQIHAETRDQVYLDEVGEVLEWLDDHPELTGRTITESRLAEVLADENWTFTPTHYFRVFSRLGITIVPDPEATNLQRLTQAIRDWEQGRGTDEILARHLDAIGVRVPEADDDRHV